MTYEVLIEVIKQKHHSGGYSSVKELKVHYGRYEELQELMEEMNNKNYNHESLISQGFIVEIDTDEIDKYSTLNYELEGADNNDRTSL